MFQSENILARQAWGIFPRSPDRRRWALLSLIFPVAFFLFVMAVLMAFPGDDDFDSGNRSFLKCLVAGAWFCVFIPFLIEIKHSNARALALNRSDYYMAGLSGRDMLLGMTAPQRAGAILFAIVFSAVLVDLNVSNHRYAEISAKVITSAIPLAILMTNLIGGMLYGISTWTKYSNRGIRILLLSFWVFSSPLTVAFMLMPLFWEYEYSGMLFLPLGFLEPITMVIRMVILATAWSGAVNCLESREGGTDF